MLGAEGLNSVSNTIHVYTANYMVQNILRRECILHVSVLEKGDGEMLEAYKFILIHLMNLGGGGDRNMQHG
jgi:hypothetical protein